MKKIKWLKKIFYGSFIAMGGFLALTANPVQADKLIGTIHNPMGSAPVYTFSSPNGNQNASLTLANGSSWIVDSTQSVNGAGTWYELGKNIWVNGYVLTVQSATPSTAANVVTTTEATPVYNAITLMVKLAVKF